MGLRSDMLRFLCFVSVLSCSSLFAEFTGTEPNIYRGVSLSDTYLLKDLSQLIFFFYVPNGNKTAEKIAIQQLQKLGKVIPKRFAEEWPFVDKEEKFIDLPSLTYELVNLQDMQGNLLPIVQATLSIKASVDITKTNTYGSSTLWYASCYVHGKKLR
jgi:hypothetical protein